MGLSLVEFRTALRTDLKCDGTLWTNAELNRCVQRAVDDLSRHLPLEKVHEETLDFTITDESFTTPATASPTYIVNAVTLNGETDGSTLTISNTRIDPPRRLTVTLTDANYSVTLLVITVKGYDQNGNYIEESWSLPELQISGTAYQGKKYFSRITSVILTKVGGSIAAGDTVSVGTGNAYDSYVFLANKPIRPKTDTVTNAAGTTTYARDTDYTMDYNNGAIKFINGGSMAAATAYLIDYTKSKLGVDVSSILPIATRITRVQYPTDLVPQQFVAFSIYGNFMHIVSKAKQSQEEMSASNDHLAIYYEQRHSPPGEGSPGSYPELLDEVVAMGAGGYALLMRAVEFEQQAATDLASMRTELGLTTAIHAQIATALGKVTTYTADMDTALDAFITAIGTNPAAALAKVTTYLAGDTESTKALLLQIATDIANLRTAVETAVDAAATALGTVSTTSLDKATTGAEAYLDTGDDKIPTLNVAGEKVADRYADYARARNEIAANRINIAIGYVQEATTRLSNLRGYIEQANGYTAIADGFIREAEGRVTLATSYLGESAQRYNMCLAFIQEADGRLTEVASHLQEASQWAETVNGDIVLSDRFRTEGLARLNEFNSILRNRAEYRKRTSSVPTKQPA